MARTDLSLPVAELRLHGPLIRVTITNPAVELDEARAVGLEFPQPLSMKALIDTGAAVTIINPEVAERWKLRQTGYARIVAAGSSGQYSEHAAAISFPGTQLRPFDPIRVVACKIVQQPVSCLIGRDILSRWLVEYDGRSGMVAVQD